MPAQQYTFCIDRSDFDAFDWKSFIPSALVLLAGIISAIFLLGPVGVMIAAIGAHWAWSKLCYFLLGGKMICLGEETSCAIGRVVELEPVGHGKSGVDRMDNDFCVNLLLAPHPPRTDRATIEGDGVQGRLIAQKSPDLDGLEFRGYNTVAHDPATNKEIRIPVLHTEFEGSRIRDMCRAVEKAIALLAIGAAICAVPVLGWIACVVVGTVAALIAGWMIIDAWNGAHGGNPKDAEVRPGNGELNAMDTKTLEGGDYVLITGRWIYDGGHLHESGDQGWTELHPAKSVQILARGGSAPWTEGSDPGTLSAFEDLRTRVCKLVQQGEDPEVIQAQANSENAWCFHPALDGCRTAEDEDKEEDVEPPH